MQTGFSFFHFADTSEQHCLAQSSLRHEFDRTDRYSKNALNYVILVGSHFDSPPGYEIY
jgi:hypothetical protein